MRQVDIRRQDGPGIVSAAEALRFRREFKNLKEAAGMPSYDPEGRDAIRRGFFGDFYNTPLDAIDKSRKVRRRAGQISADESLSKARELLGRFQDKRRRRLLVLVGHRPMDREVAHEVDRMLLQMGDIGSLDVVLDSGGGDLDAAYKALKIIKSRAKNTTVIVPFRASGAAALIALGGDSLALCRGGDLGPVDPQVLDTGTGHYTTADTIKESVGFLEGLTDQAVKAIMTDKIPTLMLGAYSASTKASRQYLEEVLADRDTPCASSLAGMLTEGHLPHGYPMDAEFLRKNGIDVSVIDGEAELMAHDLLDCYAEAERTGDGGGGAAIIHSNVGHAVIRGGGAERRLYKGEPKRRP